jgi:predicted metal-dependent hydrolase
MQSASLTPQDLKIQPRNVMFARNKGTDRWWNSHNPIATAFYNSLSLTFPKGESFFIDSVRHYRDVVPAELQSQIDAFIKQEAAHSREHAVFNGQVERTGYDTAQMHADVERRLAKRKKSPLSNLFTTAALEHFTAIIAHALLKDERHMKGASRDAARLWKWHAIEEIEHKAVAYDTLLAATQHFSAFERWKVRSLVMLFVSNAFLRARLRQLREFFKQDGINTPTTWLKTFSFLFVYPGILRQILPAWLSFFRPRFHPWQHDDRHLIAQHLSELGLPLSNPQAVVKFN